MLLLIVHWTDGQFDEHYKIDEEMLERAKYVGRKKQTYQFDERFDEDDLDYEGAKSPTLR